jgi:hypothetical protein
VEDRDRVVAIERVEQPPETVVLVGDLAVVEIDAFLPEHVVGLGHVVVVRIRVVDPHEPRLLDVVERREREVRHGHTRDRDVRVLAIDRRAVVDVEPAVELVLVGPQGVRGDVRLPCGIRCGAGPR